MQNQNYKLAKECMLQVFDKQIYVRFFCILVFWTT